MDANLWTPPHNLEMERAVIACCLISPSSAVPTARDILTSESFYASQNRAIFEAISSLFESSGVVDARLVAEHLSSSGSLESAGGIPYLAQLLKEVATTANVAHYAGRVQELFVRRQGIEVTQELMQGLRDLSNHDVMQLLQEYTGRLLQLNLDSSDDAKPMPMKQLLEEWAPCLENGPTRVGEQYHQTGFRAVDAVIGGYSDGELQYWGAGPGSGKTTAMLQSGLHLARQGKPVFIVSMELGKKRIAERLVSIAANVPGGSLQYDSPKGSFEACLTAVRSGMDKVKDVPMYFAFGRRSTDWIKRRAKDIMARHGCKLAMLGIDRLEKYADKDVEKFDNRQRISRLSNRTSAIAADLEIPVVCLCQLSRSGQKSDVPSASDFRDCGDIEQDCQVGIVIRSDKDTERSAWHVVKANDCAQGLCEAYPGADYTLAWHPRIPQFANVETRFAA